MTEHLSTDVAIVGAGPVGLFSVFELGLLGLQSVLVDSLDKPGGQCAELYPEKPIYDIPAWPLISGQELTDKLLEQIAPFEPTFRLGQRVESLLRRPDGRFVVTTSEGSVIDAAAVFIAAGAGCFIPRKPKWERLAEFEGADLFYAVRDKGAFAGKDILIVGGGDSALDWSLELLGSARSLTLVHRSDRFRAHPASVKAMQKEVEAGRMNFQLGEVSGLRGPAGALEGVTVNGPDGESELEVQRILAFFGLNIELGPIAEWELDLQDGKQIRVDTAAFQTSSKGVFAIGDINWYPGKLKLILSGFHEAALASQEAFRIARPNERLRFQYTTSSTELQQRLKVA